MQSHLNPISKVTTLAEIESPSPSIPLVEVDVINESPFPYSNPPLLDTLDFTL